MRIKKIRQKIFEDFEVLT